VNITTRKSAARSRDGCQKKIKVLLVDDHCLVREGLRALLERQPDIEVAADAGDGQSAVQAARKVRPDVVVMDIAMPVLNGIEATRMIVSEMPETKVVVLSMHGHKQIVLEVLRAGATGYILKNCAQEDLAEAIRTVGAHLTFLSQDIADSVLKDYINVRPPDIMPSNVLSKRELHVFKMLAEGKRTSEIANQLAVCVRTVENYRRRIMRKLELTSNAALTKYAIRIGLIDMSA